MALEPVAVATESTPAPAAEAIIPAAAPATPVVVESAPAAPAVVETPIVDKAAPVVDKAAPETKTNEFAPSLIEEGNKPAKVEPPAAKPADGVAKPAEQTPPTPETAPLAAPVYDDLVLPEGIKAADLNPERFNEFKSLLGENKIPKEMAEKFIGMHAAELREISTRLAQNQWDVFNKQMNAWKDEVRSDPEIGGARLDTAMRTCATVVEQYGGTAEEQKAIWNVLRATGAGNNINIVKFVHRIGEALTREATPVPVPPPRVRAPTPNERGLGRYK